MNRLKNKKFLGIDRNVYITGFVSLLTDISSEMIYPVLPLFIVNVLGAPKTVLGLIEGVAESTSSIFKVFSGYLSDRFGRRKPLILFGYSLSNLVKPLLAVTSSWYQVLFLRFADRLGKGVRTSPRDALIGDVTEPSQRGKAFGFHRSMDTVGAAIGPLAAFAILASFKNDYRLIFLLAAIPGMLAIIILVGFLRERKKPRVDEKSRIEIRFSSFDRRFKYFTLLSAIFALGNSSDAFLILRAQNLGIPVALVPIVYFLFNGVYSLAAGPAGIISDKIGRKMVLIAGFVVFGLVYLGFAMATSPLTIWLLFPFYGIYYSLTEGISRAMVTDLVPAGVRATAIGSFNFVIGVVAFPASIIAGFLWQYIAPSATFFFGAFIAVLALLMLASFNLKAE